MHIYPIRRHYYYVQMRTISPQQWEPGRAKAELAQWGRGFKQQITSSCPLAPLLLGRPEPAASPLGPLQSPRAPVPH